MTVTTVSAIDVKPADQKAVLAFLAEHGVEGDDLDQCCGIAYTPTNSPYVAAELTLTFYDHDGMGEKYLDADGSWAVWQRRVALKGELPGWWARLAREVDAPL